MAKNKPPSASDAAEQADALARAISEQLPGWKLAQKQSIANDDGSRDIRADTRGPDLKELREKFYDCTAHAGLNGVSADRIAALLAT